MDALLDYGVLGLLAWFLARLVIRRVQADRRRQKRLEKFARRELQKGDIGDETLAMLDDTEPE